MSKSAAMVSAKNKIEGEWVWGEHKIPRVCSYSYLDIDFVYNGAWDIRSLIVVRKG